jgi:hypothetical protein
MAKSKLLTRRSSKKKIPQSKREKKAINEKYWGADEPQIPSGVLTGGEYTKALSWYNIMGEYLDDTPKKWVIDYLTSQGRRDEAGRIKSVPDKWIPTTLSSQSRLLGRGAILSKDSLLAFEKFIGEALRHEGDTTEDEPSEGDPETPVFEKPTIQERTREKTSDIIGELEGLIDDGFYEDFKLDTWYREKNAKPATIKAIIEKLKPQLEELKVAKRGSDPQVKEGYSYLTKDDISILIEAYEWLIEDSERFITNVKQTRAPRKTKAPSVEKKLKFLKESYQKRSNEYNIDSIPPEKIIGAQELWVFNTKYKLVTVFRAGSMGGQLDVARCKIIGFDKNNSTSYRAGRKPAEIIEQVLKGTRASLKKISLKPCPLQERINENVILLRAN